MSNKSSALSSALKITGISTLLLTAIITIVVIISAISNSSEALGMLIGAGIIVVGVFMGMIELAASELLNVKPNELQSKANE
jgi:cytochrome c biogenesis protein CcdA